MKFVRLLSPLFAILLFLSFTSLAHAKKVHGILRVVKGKVQVKSGKTGKLSRARVGKKVYPKDTIITKKNARAKVVMIDDNVINISPDSQLEIANYEFSPKSNKKNVLLNVIYGKVRSKVKQKYNGKTSKFQIKTPSAVAGVRGTDFFTSFNPTNNLTQVVTFEGQVAFGLPGQNGQILNAVKVNVGDISSVSGSNPPAPPKKLPKRQLKNLDNASDADKAISPSSANQATAETSNEKKEEKKKSEEKERKPQSQDDQANQDSDTNLNPDGEASASRDKKANSDERKNKDVNAENDPGTANKGSRSDKKANSKKQAKRDNNARNTGNTGGELSTGTGGSGIAGTSESGKQPIGGLDEGPRGPAAIDTNSPPPPGMSDMFNPDDIAPDIGSNDILFQPGDVPELPFDSSDFLHELPKCDFCDRVVESGVTRLRVNIIQGN